MGLGMVSNGIRMGLRTALSRFLCGYSHRNGRCGGFYRFIGGFANIPQFLEPLPVSSIIFPLLLRSGALGGRGNSIFRHLSSYLYLRPRIFGDRLGGSRPGRAHHSGRGGVFEIVSAGDLQGFVWDLPPGFKGAKNANIAPRLPSVQEPSNRPPSVRISVPVVGGRVRLHAPSQEAAAKAAAATLVVPKGLIVCAAKEALIRKASGDAFDPQPAPMFFPGDPSIRMLGILLLFLIRN